MERDIQARLLVAAERMGTGLLRTGAALERIATVMEKQAKTPLTSDASTASDLPLSTGGKGDPS